MWLEDTTVEDVALAAAVVLIVSVALGSFAVDVSDATPDPVPFEDTVGSGCRWRPNRRRRTAGSRCRRRRYSTRSTASSSGTPASGRRSLR
ncbi:hypothetical protein ACFQH8_14155 [Halomicroarcula sp. GCM10025710]